MVIEKRYIYYFLMALMLLFSGCPNGSSQTDDDLPPDIGLRVFDGTEIIKIAVDYANDNYPLRIHKGNTTYGIILVEPDDPDASKIFIQTSKGIRAIKKL